MYIWTSKFVSEEMKKKIMIHAAAMRSLVKLDLQDKHDLYLGSRFNSDEQVFQSFCQKYINSEEDAQKLNDGQFHEELPKMVEQAMINAADCDYYYMYEKQWQCLIVTHMLELI